MKERIRLMLVDDQLLFLESLKMVIENLDESISVVGVAQNGQEAVNRVPEMNPNLIMMDVRMPVMDGVQATGILKARFPEIKVIMLTTFGDDEYVKDALKNGAVGYMLKNIPPQMLVSAIHAVFDGSILIAPDIATHLINSLGGMDGGKEQPARLPDWYRDLTSREKFILKYIVGGYSNKEISSIIHVGEQTVRNYISSIYSKLDVHHRKGAVEKARSLDSYLNG